MNNGIDSYPAMAARQPLIGFGEVRHIRLRPARNAFVYPTYFLFLPMRALTRGAASAIGALPVNRRAALSFFDSDHGDGRGPSQGGALAWLDMLLNAEGITDATGEAWLHCYPRVLGYSFKPVSFWYCHTEKGALRAIVVEVNNTFGERHCYLLDHPQLGVESTAAKVFHVSPFCSVEGNYRFRFMVTQPHGQPPQTLVRIDHDNSDGPLLQTSVGGILEPLTAKSVRRALWAHPWLTVAVVAHIHWQALCLWRKRVRFHKKPAPPKTFVSR